MERYGCGEGVGDDSSTPLSSQTEALMDFSDNQPATLFVLDNDIFLLPGEQESEKISEPAVQSGSEIPPTESQVLEYVLSKADGIHKIGRELDCYIIARRDQTYIRRYHSTIIRKEDSYFLYPNDEPDKHPTF